jgi:hypothetical protein
MRRRSIITFRPGLERFERKQLLATASVTAQVASAGDGFAASAVHAAEVSDIRQAAAHNTTNHTALRVHPDTTGVAPVGAYGYLAFRVTNTPHQTPYNLIPPFQQVLVQGVKPIPGHVYNVCDVAVKNGTSVTFTASSGFTVRLNNQPKSFPGFPILTGNEEWKPGQVLVFYVLTKKYYPVSFVAGGFQFDLGGRSSTAIPGPSGIFLRLKYNPDTFARTLNWIVAYGQGNQLGQGAKFGLPNTSINQIVDARTHRMDFAGHF